MANSPIQIVLNTNDFITVWDRNGGGPHKDFYEDKDQAFVLHRDSISSQLFDIKRAINENAFSGITYAKLTLKQSALAKSHRPTSAMFRKDIAPVVGGGDLGELFVELTASSINKITSKMEDVETETRWKTDKNGKEVAHPSELRSEIGAIEEIRAYTASDKRKFSVNDGFKWLSQPQTGGAYIIELFETPPPRHDWDNLTEEKLSLFKSFIDGLTKFNQGIVASRVADNTRNQPLLGIKLEESSAPANIQWLETQSISKRRNTFIKISQDVSRHTDLLNFLDNHPLVKKILLPPIITKSDNPQFSSDSTKKFNVPKVKKDKLYPKIAIVDGGVSDVLNEWVEEKWGFLGDTDKDEEHGTFIAGLLVSGNELNGLEVCKESDGCKIIDLDLLPKTSSFENYYLNPLLFFQELEIAVKELKARTGVRIFNFSLNIEEHVSSDGYSPAAKMLDKIAEDNDVVFVISAGNTGVNDFRKEWPSDAIDALSILASSKNDIIKTPAESCRNISVSALNPPNMKGIIPFAPSNYSCRGPGIRVGLKPDLAHVGGAGTRITGKGHGLHSIDTNGNITNGCGTSYAAPNVAKTLACLDEAIEGEVSRESLIALAVHHATLPKVLQDKKFKEIAKHLVGFGTPKDSDSILKGNDHSITLVFANRIHDGKRMSFNFTWPPSLVRSGKCFGYARLTLVSTPPFDYRYGAEFVRVNIDAHLRQEQKDGRYNGKLKSIYLPDNSGNPLYEKNQISHSFKWSPIKVYEGNFSRGIGESTSWKLEVDYLARSGESVPRSGVPFTALLTIADPDGEAPIFNDMRQSLQSFGVQTVDIRNAARILNRV